MKNLTLFAKTLLALGALLVFAAPTLAQKTTPPPPARKQGDLRKQLNLTPTQDAKIKAIMKDAGARWKALRDNTTLTPEQKRTQMQAISKTSMAKVNAILTPAQRAKVKAARAANGPRPLKR